MKMNYLLSIVNYIAMSHSQGISLLKCHDWNLNYFIPQEIDYYFKSGN